MLNFNHHKKVNKKNLIKLFFFLGYSDDLPIFLPKILTKNYKRKNKSVYIIYVNGSAEISNLEVMVYKKK